MTKSTLCCLALSTLVPVASALGDVHHIGNRKQLFIDQKFVMESSGVELRMNSPVKLGKVLTGSDSWDCYSIIGIVYGTVLDDQGKYRMWYGARSAGDQYRARICYAESEDGIHWRKPNLGLYEWHGSKANNILMMARHESCGVFIDPKAPAAERYKIVGLLHERSERAPDGEAPHGSGLYMYTSPDGLRWTLHPEKVFPFAPDTLNMALYDDRTGKYLAYVRTWNPLRRVGVVEIDDIMRPWPYDKNVPPRDPHSLTGPPTAPSREISDAFGTDGDDPPNLDFYTPAVVKYPWADDAYLMFPSAYRHFPEPPKGEFRNDGVLEIDFATSRDGRKFHRISRLPYIGLGQNGDPDSLSNWMFIGMIRRDNTVYQYYAGYDHTHHDGGDGTMTGTANRGGVFVVRQRLDGFASVDAGPAGGGFVTSAVMFTGTHLHLNLDASATGEIRVELQNVEGQPLPGYAFADCDAIGLNDVAKLVTWSQGRSDVGSLAGRPIRLAFRLRSAKLYAFQFGD